MMKAEYNATNPAVKLLGNFLPNRNENDPQNDPLDSIEWSKPKASLTLEQMCDTLEEGLRNREWFVTGRALPELFSDDFAFQDPDVQLRGIEQYSRQVRRLFDQSTARAEIISCNLDGEERLIRVVWRLSGSVNLLGGVHLKPFVVTTRLSVDATGLINFQEDEFSIPGYDILLSAFFPVLRPWLAPAAPPLDRM